MRCGWLLVAGCRIGFESPVDGGRTGDSATGTPVVFQSTARSGPCDSSCNSGPSHPIDHVLVPGAARLLVVFVGCGEGAISDASARYGGVSLTRLGGKTGFGSFEISGELFFATEAQLSAIPDNTKDQITFPAQCYAGIAIQLANVDQANPIDAFAVALSTDPNLSTVDVATADSNALLVDGVSSGREGDRQISLPMDSGQTLRGDVQYNSNSGGGYSVTTRPVDGPTTTMVRGLDSDLFPFAVHVAAAIHPR